MERYSGLGNLDQASQNLWVGNMKLTFFCTPKLVFNCRIEQNRNKTQFLTKVLECQFLTAHQTKYLQIFCVTETVLLLFVETNSQHKHIFIRSNKQQHPTP